MAAFFSITLVVSIGMLALLLGLKRYEMNTGRVVFGGARPMIGGFFHIVLVFVERGVPNTLKSVTVRVGRAVRTVVQQLLARAIVFFEHMLEQVLYVVRQKSEAPRGDVVASPFLQEVAAHKQKLLRGARRKRTIIED